MCFWVSLRAAYGPHSSYSGRPRTALAVAWADILKKRTIVCNIGSCLRADGDSIRHRQFLEVIDGVPSSHRGDISVPRPVVIEMFFRHFAAIDIHDHLRQGLLQIERAWKTNTWEHRIFN